MNITVKAIKRNSTSISLQVFCEDKLLGAIAVMDKGFQVNATENRMHDRPEFPHAADAIACLLQRKKSLIDGIVRRMEEEERYKMPEVHPLVIAVYQRYYPHKPVVLRRYDDLYLTDDDLLPWWKDNNDHWFSSDSSAPRIPWSFVGLACMLPSHEAELQARQDIPVEIVID
jgi:hypothetical protein